jgi:hypothetical protein
VVLLLLEGPEEGAEVPILMVLWEAAEVVLESEVP